MHWSCYFGFKIDFKKMQNHSHATAIPLANSASVMTFERNAKGCELFKLGSSKLTDIPFEDDDMPFRLKYQDPAEEWLEIDIFRLEMHLNANNIVHAGLYAIGHDKSIKIDKLTYSYKAFFANSSGMAKKMKASTIAQDIFMKSNRGAKPFLECLESNSSVQIIAPLANYILKWLEKKFEPTCTLCVTMVFCLLS